MGVSGCLAAELILVEVSSHKVYSCLASLNSFLQTLFRAGKAGEPCRSSVVRCLHGDTVFKSQGNWVFFSTGMLQWMV